MCPWSSHLIILVEVNSLKFIAYYCYKNEVDVPSSFMYSISIVLQLFALINANKYLFDIFTIT